MNAEGLTTQGNQIVRIYIGIVFLLAAIYDSAYNIYFGITGMFNVNFESWVFKNYNNIYGSRGFVIAGIILIVSIMIFIFSIKKIRFRTRIYDQTISTILCFYLFFVFFSYGFAKIFGNQFSMDTYYADKPFSELNGFVLTWLYFGYSTAYGWFIALSQFVGAMLLVIKRMRYIGVFLLIPVITNIILIDFCYQVGNDVKVISVFYFLVLIFIGQPIFFSLIRHLVSASTGTNLNHLAFNLKNHVFKISIIATIIFYTYYSNEKQCIKYQYTLPVTGIWNVEYVSFDNQKTLWNCKTDSIPRKIYFEKGGIYYTVYNDTDQMGMYRTTGDSIYLGKSKADKPVFSGIFQLADSVLVLSGIDQKSTPIIYRMRLSAKVK